MENEAEGMKNKSWDLLCTLLHDRGMQVVGMVAIQCNSGSGQGGGVVDNLEGMVEIHTKAVNYEDTHLVLIALEQPPSSITSLPPGIL